MLNRKSSPPLLVWFDIAATTQKPQSVLDRLAWLYAHENSNIHRGTHELAARATDACEAARNKVACFIGAGSADEVIFVRGATEAINLVAKTWGVRNIGAGDESSFRCWNTPPAAQLREPISWLHFLLR